MTEAGERKQADEATGEPEQVDAPAQATGEAESQAELDELEDEALFDKLDDIDLRESLRSALRPPSGSVAPSLLTGVQKKLRTRSRGKFYGDGWSTARSPKSTYLITSILMLLLIALVFAVLVPWAGGVLPLP